MAHCDLQMIGRAWRRYQTRQRVRRASRDVIERQRQLALEARRREVVGMTVNDWRPEKVRLSLSDTGGRWKHRNAM